MLIVVLDDVLLPALAVAARSRTGASQPPSSRRNQPPLARSRREEVLSRHRPSPFTA